MPGRSVPSHHTAVVAGTAKRLVASCILQLAGVVKAEKDKILFYMIFVSVRFGTPSNERLNLL